jgi:hypothetical protein
MQAKDRILAFNVARTCARIAFDHALRSEMRFDSIAQGSDIAIILYIG